MAPRLFRGSEFQSCGETLVFSADESMVHINCRGQVVTKLKKPTVAEPKHPHITVLTRIPRMSPSVLGDPLRGDTSRAR